MGSSHIKTRDGNSLFTLDWGTGEPLVLVHGWPLSSAMWEYQMTVLPHLGIRCVAYDRRGFGRSSQPWEGYNYDTFSDDLADVLDALDLQDVTLAGFSMGGGEVARYMSRHGGKRIKRIALLGAVTPFLLQTPDNPDGAPRSVFDGMIEGLSNDRPGFLSEFVKGFYGVGMLTSPVSNSFVSAFVEEAMQASPKGTLDCVRAFSETDFRGDLPGIKVPTLILHGDADATVPIDLTAKQAAKLIPGAELKVYSGAPHGFTYTHRDAVNADLAAFMGKSLS